MSLARVLALLSVAVLFVPAPITDGTRLVVALVLVAASFSAYASHKISQWRGAGLDIKRLMSRKAIAVLAGVSGALLGAVLGSAIAFGSIETADETYLLIDAGAGAIFGVLMGAAVERPMSDRDHAIVGAVAGALGGAAAGGMSALYPGTTSARIAVAAAVSLLAGSGTGAAVGLALGRFYRRLFPDEENGS